jgi:thioredoxin-dependent peroxiredoxin
VIGVSGDSQATNDRFRASLDLPYPLVGDPDGSIRDAYGVKWPVVGLARRTTYVIGQDKKVQRAFRSESDPEAHVAEACAFVRPAR